MTKSPPLPTPLILTVRQGPVVMLNLEATGELHNDVSLWSGITAEEHHPGAQGGASYTLQLRKPVRWHEEIQPAETDLKEALRYLSRVWHFAGGAVLGPKPNQVVEIELPEYKSNASELANRLPPRTGRRRVAVDFTFNYEHLAGYSCMPLARATELAKLARQDPTLEQLFRYHWLAQVDRDKWYIHLGKIRDVFQGNVGRSPPGLKKLREAIDHSSRDLRHAPKPGQDIPSPRDQFEKYFSPSMELTKGWIEAYVAEREASAPRSEDPQ